MNANDITNLRNRIAASEKAPAYADRTHVDVPRHVLMELLDERDAMLGALRGMVDHAYYGVQAERWRKLAEAAIAKAESRP